MKSDKILGKHISLYVLVIFYVNFVNKSFSKHLSTTLYKNEKIVAISCDFFKIINV